MIECVFTLDYEIYGNGEGSLRELVLEPTRRLVEVFDEFAQRLVIFAECLEFRKIEEAGSDPDTDAVRAQLRQLRAGGHEIGLHLHPWWANASYENGRWRLDWSERNICALAPKRIEELVGLGISYLRDALAEPAFTPHSFRSGLWVMQPTGVIAAVLARHGIRVDSSAFKGGLVRAMGLDYRAARARGDAWRFGASVTEADPRGTLWEVPIHTRMVAPWRMLGRKRLQLQQKANHASAGMPPTQGLLDFCRLRYPRKLDFCRMTFDDMRSAIETVLREKATARGERRIVVAIGHSKDLVDCHTVRRFLEYLRGLDVRVTTFSELFATAPQLAGDIAGAQRVGD